MKLLVKENDQTYNPSSSCAFCNAKANAYFLYTPAGNSCAGHIPELKVFICLSCTRKIYISLLGFGPSATPEYLEFVNTYRRAISHSLKKVIEHFVKSLRTSNPTQISVKVFYANGAKVDCYPCGEYTLVLLTSETITSVIVGTIFKAVLKILPSDKKHM
jgi:sRNA-binding regulator protein Hfq